MAARERDKATLTAATEAQIATNIRNFIEHHKSKGTRKKSEQDAVDTVLVACTFGDIDDPKHHIANSLNAPRLKFQECKRWGKRLREHDERFEPEERKKRSDSCRDAAKESVHAFCHSEEGSRLDTSQSPRVVNVPNLETGKPEQHPLRVWNTLGLSLYNRHKSFLESQSYKSFIEIHVGKVISREMFRLSICKCVRDSPKSLQGLAQRSAKHNNVAFQQYEAELKTILGVHHITVNCLTEALQQRNLALSGLKHEKAERLLSYHRNLTRRKPNSSSPSHMTILQTTMGVTTILVPSRSTVREEDDNLMTLNTSTSQVLKHRWFLGPTYIIDARTET
jgi:hypothetical protein